MTNMSQFSRSVTDLPKVSQISCDILEEHEVYSALCLWVHYLLAQYTSSRSGSPSPGAQGGGEQELFHCPFLKLNFFQWPE